MKFIRKEYFFVVGESKLATVLKVIDDAGVKIKSVKNCRDLGGFENQWYISIKLNHTEYKKLRKDIYKVLYVGSYFHGKEA